MRKEFVGASIVIVIAILIVTIFYPPIAWSFILIVPLLAVGYYDYFQHRHAVMRNFPLIGRGRYLFETIRPEIYQYFIESDTDGVPFGRDKRSLVYQRAKGVRDTVPFGTLQDVYETGYEWINHSLAPVHIDPQKMRVKVGGKNCSQPYLASILNISAMSYGSLSKNAVLALNQGAKMGDFYHNTGEGGISPYHRAGNGDLVWQIGTGYFGCRAENGRFDPDLFTKNATDPQVKMIEIKLSQGAKPGHGGILPAAKVTEEIATIRGVPLGKDVLSPPSHSSFSTPIEMMQFIAHLRELSDGKPIGFKLCIGKPREFLALCKAMIQTGISPDFITVDGGEGGTGAAPLEFSNHIGTPIVEGLIVVHNALLGFNLRDDIRIIASGKVLSAFSLVKLLALGADACNSARAMMLSLGCIQALRCNSNHCPVGIATQDPNLMAGLVPVRKSKRVANFHKETLEVVAEIVGATGINITSQLRPWHIERRVSATEVLNYGQIYEYLEPGVLLQKPVPATYKHALESASPETFASVLHKGW
ncbi:MAG: FMN-binding glutamate synthase family protein [Chloroflexi bacterium]|nr:FMN-binding glutamate synthase family protein [Chloroflexota bacterium]